MIVRAQILDMGEFARMGFTFECYGCEVVWLLHDGEKVIGLKQTEATKHGIQAECARHLATKHGWDGCLWQRRNEGEGT